MLVSIPLMCSRKASFVTIFCLQFVFFVYRRGILLITFFFHVDIHKCFGPNYLLFSNFDGFSIKPKDTVIHLLLGFAIPLQAYILWINAVKALLSQLWKRNQCVFQNIHHSSWANFDADLLKSSSWCSLLKKFVGLSVQDIYRNRNDFIFSYLVFGLAFSVMFYLSFIFFLYVSDVLQRLQFFLYCIVTFCSF